MPTLYTLQSALFKLIGDIQWFGWSHPFWFAVSPRGYKLKGEHYRAVAGLIKPGDILLQRFEGWIDKWFIPGFWNHAGIYLGNNQVVHAVSEGVLSEDIINFMRTDHLIVLRPFGHLAEYAVERANEIVGAEYDFNFDFLENKKFSCTEVVDYCYPKMIERKKIFGRPSVKPDDIANSPLLSCVWDSRKCVSASWKTRIIKPTSK